MKGFIRTIEVILSSLLLLSFWGAVLMQSSIPITSLQREPRIITYSLLKSMNNLNLLKESINDYDLKNIDSMINNFLPGNMYHEIEAVYLKEIIIKETQGDTINEPILFLSYNFPVNIDQNSINALSDSALPVMIEWNWYLKKITIQNDNTKRTPINLGINNITLTGDNVKPESIVLYCNNKKNRIDLEWSNTSSEECNASITAEVFLEKNEIQNCQLYYANNQSIYNSSFTELSPKEAGANIITGAGQDSKRADILIQLNEIKAFEEKKIYLKYSIGRGENTAYKTINKNPSQGLTASFTDESKLGSFPIRSIIADETAQESSVFISTDQGLSELKIRSWYS